MSLKVSDEEYNALCQLVGNIAIQASFLEQALDVTISFIFHELGGRDHSDGQALPRGLKRKIRYLRLCFLKVSSLHRHSEHALSLLHGISNASRDRNNIIHGVFQKFDSARRLCTFAKLDAVGVFHHESLNSYTFDQLLKLSDTLLKYGRSVIELNQRIFELDPNISQTNPE
ncbi:hypothetical protein [Aestuariivirga sp.]|uniref:hypothetical protein n=1 Tax=Aestuariivirga sp. TaxID=2650926 RepID=UPI003593FAD3